MSTYWGWLGTGKDDGAPEESKGSKSKEKSHFRLVDSSQHKPAKLFPRVPTQPCAAPAENLPPSG